MSEAIQKKYARRTRLLINRGFQLRYMGIFVSAALLAALVIGGVLYYLVEINWVLQIERGLNLFSETRQLMLEQRFFVLIAFTAVFLILSGLLSIWGLYLSHRVAGPVFALSRRIGQIITEHDIMTPLQFRKKDALEEVKYFFNETLKIIEKRKREELEFFNMLSRKIFDSQDRYPHYQSQFRSLLRRMESFKKDKEQWWRVNAQL